MRILVIEDERLVALSLMRLVKELRPDARLEGPLESVAEAKSWFQSQVHPDLILSDIQLADGISFDLFSEISMLTPVIFTTAFDEYAIRAFKVNSIDYLLKPIEKQDLATALEKFERWRSSGNSDMTVYRNQLEDMMRHFNLPRRFKERFPVHAGRNLILVHQEQVAAFVKEEVIYLLHQDGRKMITDYRSLDEVEELVDPEVYFRANRQVLLQLPFVHGYRSDETGKLLVKLRGSIHEDIPVSKEKAAEFRRWVEG